MQFAHRLLLAALCFVVLLQFSSSDEVDAKSWMNRDNFVGKLAGKGANLKTKGARFMRATKNDMRTTLRNATAELEAVYVDNSGSALSKKVAKLAGNVLKETKDNLVRNLKDSMRSNNLEDSKKNVEAQ